LDDNSGKGPIEQKLQFSPGREKKKPIIIEEGGPRY
jgi:hypothetical protein